MSAEFAIVSLLIAVYALVAARLNRLSIGSALFFVAMGFLLSDDLFGPISLSPEAEPVKLLAEATLTLLLFADPASGLRARALRRDAAPIVRLLADRAAADDADRHAARIRDVPRHLGRHCADDRRRAGADRCRTGTAGHHQQGRAAAHSARAQR